MRRIALGIVALWGLTAFAQNRTIEADYVRGQNYVRNFVINPDAEVNLRGVVASGSTVTRNLSIGPIEGLADFAVTLNNNATDTVTWSLKDRDIILNGQNCEARIQYASTSIGSNVRVQVLQGSTVVVESSPLVNTGSLATVLPVVLNFPCSISGSTIVLRNATGNTGSSAMRVDSVNYSRATNVGTVAQAESVVRASASLAQSIASGVITQMSFASEDYDTYGEFASNVFTAQRAGRYLITCSVLWSASGSTGQAVEIFIRKNGVNQSANRSINDGVAFDLRIQNTDVVSLNVGETADCAFTHNAGANRDITIRFITVSRFPSVSEQVFRPDLLPWRVDASISGANPSIGTGAQTTYGEISNASLSMTQNAGSIPVGVPCSGTNPGTVGALTCSVGSESTGVTFNLPRPGDVLACASFTYVGVTGGTGAVEPYFQLVETPNNAQTILQEGGARIGASVSNLPFGLSFPLRVCGNFRFDSIGQKTIRLFYEQLVSGTVTTSQLNADGSASAGQRDIKWEVYPITQAFPAPLLVGSVTSNSAGIERIERARIGWTAGVPSVTRQSGNWIASLTDSAPGQVIINFVSGIWSSPPDCVCVGEDNTNLTCKKNSDATVSSQALITLRPTTVSGVPAAAEDMAAVSVICMGPR